LARLSRIAYVVGVHLVNLDHVTFQMPLTSSPVITKFAVEVYAKVLALLVLLEKDGAPGVVVALVAWVDLHVLVNRDHVVPQQQLARGLIVTLVAWEGPSTTVHLLYVNSDYGLLGGSEITLVAKVSNSIVDTLDMNLQILFPDKGGSAL